MQEIKEKPITLRKKIRIYVDISLKDDSTFQIGQRLISFFGQSSIFENTDEITDYLEEYLCFSSLNFLTFGDNNSMEADLLSSSYNNVLNIEPENENIEADQDNYLNKNMFFLPIIIFFYYSEKRTDFFFLKTFKKKFQKNLHKWLMILNFLKSKERKINNFNNFNYFNNIKKYIFNVKILRNFNNVKFMNILKLTNTTFLKPEEIFFQPWDSFIFMFCKRKNKFSFFKFFKNKKQKNVFSLFKSIFSMPVFYIFNVVVTKINFLDEEFDYNFFFETLFRYASQLYISKKALFRRLRRKKRFKKKTVRNFNGIKTAYYKIYSFVQPKKKGKRR